MIRRLMLEEARTRDVLMPQHSAPPTDSKSSRRFLRWTGVLHQWWATDIFRTDDGLPRVRPESPPHPRNPSFWFRPWWSAGCAESVIAARVKAIVQQTAAFSQGTDARAAQFPARWGYCPCAHPGW